MQEKLASEHAREIHSESAFVFSTKSVIGASIVVDLAVLNRYVKPLQLFLIVCPLIFEAFPLRIGVLTDGQAPPVFLVHAVLRSINGAAIDAHNVVRCCASDARQLYMFASC